jgi:hypothetical protein
MERSQETNLQIKFTEDELRRLDQIADEYGFETPSAVKAAATVSLLHTNRK